MMDFFVLKYWVVVVEFDLYWFDVSVVFECCDVVFVFDIGLFVFVNWYFGWWFVLCVDLVDVGFEVMDCVVCVW